MTLIWNVLIEARTNWGGLGENACDDMLDEVLNQLLDDKRIAGPALSYNIQTNEVELLCDVEGDIAEVVKPAVEALREAVQVACHADPTSSDLEFIRVEIGPIPTE